MIFNKSNSKWVLLRSLEKISLYMSINTSVQPKTLNKNVNTAYLSPSARLKESFDTVDFYFDRKMSFLSGNKTVKNHGCQACLLRKLEPASMAKICN